MKLFKHSQVSTLLVVGLLGVGMLTACGARRQAQGTALPAAPQATAARAATTAPQPTTVPPVTMAPAAMPVPAQVDTQAPPTPTSTDTPAPTATVAPQADQSGAALDQLLQKLEAANSAGDSLSDVPELK